MEALILQGQIYFCPIFRKIPRVERKWAPPAQIAAQNLTNVEHPPILQPLPSKKLAGIASRALVDKLKRIGEPQRVVGRPRDDIRKIGGRLNRVVRGISSVEK